MAITVTPITNGNGNHIEGDATNNDLTPDNPTLSPDDFAGDDLVQGNEGNDTLDGGSGNNTLEGGAGDDTYVIDDQGLDAITEVTGQGNADTYLSYLDSFTMPGGIGDPDVENLTLHDSALNASGTGNNEANTIKGNVHNNILHGGGGNDNIQGGAGDDKLYGDAGDDKLQGGIDDDTYYVDSGDTVTESVGAGTDTVYASGSFELENLNPAEIEKLVLQGDADYNATGNDFNNTIVGNSGNNVLKGGGGLDNLQGLAGNDTYIVDGGETISELGGGGNDTVESTVDFVLDDPDLENLVLKGTADINGTGNAGVNTITGNTGNNIIDGRGGVDILDGAGGNDIYIVEGVADTINDTGATTDTDTVRTDIDDYTLGGSIENLELTGDALKGTGNTDSNKIVGNDRSNTLDGGAGNDILKGGLDNDTYLVNSAGDDILEVAGQGDADEAISTAASFTLDAQVEKLTLGVGAFNGTGNDSANTITGNDNNNILNGGLGNDTISGLGGNDDLDGGAGDDSLVGGAGDDTLDGVLGNDALEGGLGSDVYFVNSQTLDVITEVSNADDATTAKDRVESSVTYKLGANLEDLTLTGTTAINGIGNDEANYIKGNNANNVLKGLGGTDKLEGGFGNDTYHIDDTQDEIVERAGEGTDSVISSVDFDLNLRGANVENLTLLDLATNAPTVGTGNDRNNTIQGNSAKNILDGKGGTDILQGGSGDDTYYVDLGSDTVVEDNDQGNDTVYSSATWTMSAHVENLILKTGAGAINGFGNDINNNITGNESANILDGKLGADKLTGLGGNDTYIVNDAGDQTIEAVNGGTDTVKSSIDWTQGLAADIENLTLTGTAAISGKGNGLSNTITGNDSNNTLDGASGSDRLIGGKGSDTYKVDSSTDQTIEALNAGTDTVESSVSWTLGNNVENLDLLTGAVVGTGNDLANTIKGNNAGNTLAGKGGSDILTGGGGADNFRFGSTTERVDTITDFLSVDDTIQISRAGFSTGLALGTISASQFVIGSAAVDGSDRFIYDKFGSGGLYFDPTGNANGISDRVQFADLVTGTSFTNADIQIIA